MKPVVQFEDAGEDAKLDEDCKMGVDGEADSRKNLEIRKIRDDEGVAQD